MLFINVVLNVELIYRDIIAQAEGRQVMEDREIIIRIKNRDTRGLEELINLYNPVVYSLVYRVMGSNFKREDVEECASDVFVDIWNSIEDFNENRGGFKTWVLVKAKFKALDYRRRIGKRLLSEEGSLNLEDLKERTDKNEVEEQVLRKEEHKNILNALGNLNELDREIFIRRYFLHEDIDSIAKSCSLTRSAVDNRLWRGKKTLRDFLGEDFK